MSDHPVNALANASSAYLRSAMHQPVQWQQWGEAAFAQAVAEDKPVLLDIGAVWCHWCHVMDRESYEDASLAQLINEQFVAVKVDRDERPDVDTRYQAAVSAISGQGGWPLTAFLTPDGRPYFGGTYFPPEERYGQPSFRRVLMTMAASFQQSRGDVEESAGSVMEAVEYSENFTGDPGDLEAPSAGFQLLDKLVASALGQFDRANGGFGSQPKFPHPAALDMLLDAASRPHPQAAAAQQACLVTLKKMVRGGICDQLLGGFHRYSVDERWVVPHFEKMLYDNSALLGTYIHAFQAFGDAECAEAATGIMRWIDESLSDREQGGFFASQDADLSLDDDGDYFTWTHAEAATVLTADEMRFAELYFDIGAVGDMKHDPARNVLFRTFTAEQAAERAGLAAASGADLAVSVTAKLRAARLLRTAPFIDRTIYTAWNGMCVSAYVQAGRVLQRPDATAFAVASLDRILETSFHEGMVSHVVAYADGAVPHVRVAGLLDDYVFLGHACLDVWEVSGKLKYYQAAEQLGRTLLAHFYDGKGGGFFDMATNAVDTFGALQARRKPLQDAPTPAGNPAGASLLLRLHALDGNPAYRDNAQETLECFAGVAEHLGLYAASYGLAIGRLARPAIQVVIVGEGEEAVRLEAAATHSFQVNRSVIRLRGSQVQSLPPALADTLPHLPRTEGAVALVCVGTTCHPPVSDAAALRTLLSSV